MREIHCFYCLRCVLSNTCRLKKLFFKAPEFNVTNGGIQLSKQLAASLANTHEPSRIKINIELHCLSLDVNNFCIGISYSLACTIVASGQLINL